MKVKTPMLGGVCQSLTGRDKDEFYIIVGITQNAVLVADGKYKSVNNPKKKNVKHLRLLPQTVAQIAAQLQSGKPVYDNQIAYALSHREDGEIGG